MGYSVDSGSTQGVDIGAPAGTAVYAPADGQVVSITPYILNGDATRYGQEIAISPSSDPSFVVKIAPIALAVGPLRQADAAGRPAGHRRTHEARRASSTSRAPASRCSRTTSRTRATARASGSSRPPLPRCRSRRAAAVHRRHLRAARARRRRGARAAPARGARARPRDRQRRERRRRRRHHRPARGHASWRAASTASRSATTPGISADSAATSSSEPRIVRPANYLSSAPGRGSTIVEAATARASP